MDLRRAAEFIRREKSDVDDYLSRWLGRQPTTEEVDNWTRVGIFNKLESGDIKDALPALETWANKYDNTVTQRLTDELLNRQSYDIFKRMKHE